MGLVSGAYSILAQCWPPSANWSVNDVPDLTGRVIIVTGASSGIGLSCAKTLAAKGGTVYIACLTEEDCTSTTEKILHATGNTAHSLKMDLASFAAVERAARDFLSREAQLHILLNNAGVWGPKVPITEDGLETTFQTNVAGAYYFTHLLMPALLLGAQSSPDGTASIVGTSSLTAEVAKLDYTTLAPLKCGEERSISKPRAEALYAQSKFGVAIYARELARRFQGHGIVSTVAHPGVISTGLYRNLPSPLRIACNALTWFPDQGALTLLYCGVSEDTKKSNGKYFIPWTRPGNQGQPQACVEDPAVGKRLWEWMEDRVRRREAFGRARYACEAAIVAVA